MKLLKTVFVVYHPIDGPISVWTTKDEAKKFIARWGFVDTEIVKYKHIPKEEKGEDN